jgi:hypothetical protein
MSSVKMNGLPFNKLDDTKALHVNRVSHLGPYAIADGLPRFAHLLYLFMFSLNNTWSFTPNCFNGVFHDDAV